MYYYNTLAIIGLTCVTTSALTVPNVLPPELWVARSTDHDTIKTLESRVHSGIQVAETKSHSYDPSYKFRSGDGWEPVPVTNLPYKYGNASNARSDQQRRQQSRTKRGVKVNMNVNVIGGTVGHAVGEVWNELKGLGKAQGVTITWYTGEDLQNPSCWPESDWAPTDASFACALTLEGWNNKPSCFKFLELCNGPDKCIFVRVVDTCAGCKKGSRHVDLTKAAFAALADLDVGILTVQMRMATSPRVWHKSLWGPKV